MADSRWSEGLLLVEIELLTAWAKEGQGKEHRAALCLDGCIHLVLIFFCFALQDQSSKEANEEHSRPCVCHASTRIPCEVRLRKFWVRCDSQGQLQVSSHVTWNECTNNFEVPWESCSKANEEILLSVTCSKRLTTTHVSVHLRVCVEGPKIGVDVNVSHLSHASMLGMTASRMSEQHTRTDGTLTCCSDGT